MYVNERQDDWDERLPDCLHAYVTSVQDTLGTSPYCLLFGMEPRMPVDLMLPTDLVTERTDKKREDQLRTLVKARTACYERQVRRQQARDNPERTRRPERPASKAYLPGSCVLLKRDVPPDIAAKMGHKYDGPFWVTAAPTDGERDIYGILKGKPYVEKAVAVERLQPVPEIRRDSLYFHHKAMDGVTLSEMEELMNSSTNSSSDTSENVFVVENVIGRRAAKITRANRTGVEYLVKWKGYSTSNNSWEPEDGLRKNAARYVDRYLKEEGLDRKGAKVGKANRSRRRARERKAAEAAEGVASPRKRSRTQEGGMRKRTAAVQAEVSGYDAESEW